MTKVGKVLFHVVPTWWTGLYLMDGNGILLASLKEAQKWCKLNHVLLVHHGHDDHVVIYQVARSNKTVSIHHLVLTTPQG